MPDELAPAPVPRTRSLRRLREAAAGCRACDLYAHATQTVFGSGPRTARIVMVGEQPGDVEDREGDPFVGPAGRLLDGVALDGTTLVATVHPAAVLRSQDREAAYGNFVADLETVAKL